MTWNDYDHYDRGLAPTAINTAPLRGANGPSARSKAGALLQSRSFAFRSDVGWSLRRAGPERPNLRNRRSTTCGQEPLRSKAGAFKTLLTVFCLLFATHLSAEEAANVAVGKTATVLFGATASGSNPAYAVDGNAATYWQSNTNYKQILVVDLGARYDLSKVVLKWDGNYFATTLDLLYSETLISTDNVGAAVRTTVSRAFGNGPVTDTFDNLNATARYVGIQTRGRNNTSPYNGDHYRLLELEVFGTKNAGTYEPPPIDPEQQAALDEIVSRLVTKCLNGNKYAGDTNPAAYFNAMQADGSWSTIDYNDKISIGGWAPATHLSYLITMAVAFRTPASAYYESAEMQERIERGLLYYKERNPTAGDNWWYTDIGDPQKYMIPALLLKGYSTYSTLADIAAYLRDLTDKTSVEGQNLAWCAEIVTYKGCAENNYNLTLKSFTAMSNTLKIAATQGIEGIKIDGSFHQHHAQIYSGGYGLSITDYISASMELAAGTSFAAVYTPIYVPLS
jgi:chondroitin AC lyase